MPAERMRDAVACHLQPLRGVTQQPQSHIVPSRRHLDPAPSPRPGTLYSAANLAAGRFSFQTQLGSGERMRVALGPSGGILGEVSSHAGTTIVDARTQTHLTADTFHWPLDAGDLSVEGPLALEELAVALTFAPGAAPAGRVTAPRARAGHLEIEVPQLAGAIEVSHLEIGELRVALEEHTTRLIVGSLRIGRVRIPLPSGDLRIDDLEVTGVELISERGAPVEIGLKAIEVNGAKLELDGGYVALHDVLVTGLRVARELTIRQARADSAHVVVTERKPPAPRPPGRRSSPIDLSFLDGLEGHIHADVSTHVRLPLVPDWRALHRVRLDVREGRVEFGRLEHGLSRLPDAVLDFNLRDGALCLDKAIPLVPFNRATLLSWPLPDDELLHADEGWVQLSRLFEPRVEIRRRPRARDDVGGSLLQEIRIHDIDVSVSLGTHEVILLPSGGRLRLGAAASAKGSEALGAFDEAHARGEVVYRPGPRRPEGAVAIEADQLALGLEGVRIGERTLDVPQIRIGQIRSEIRTRDLSVERVHTDLEDIEIEGLVIAA